MLPYDTSGGAEFVKADLHVHTPDSYDYQDDVDAAELIEAFEEEDMRLVAVTDHNTTGFYNELAEAAEESSVTVLPGVEITTGQSGEHQIHVTAIFPPEKADDIDNLLYEVGADGDPQTVIADKTIPKICEEVREFDGLPILAHIDAKAGAHHELSDRKNPTRQKVFDEDLVAAVEITSLDTRSEFPEFTHIKSSDAHGLSQVGRGYTYLKMDDPSFEGLRTALSDSESRVSLELNLDNHASIDGLQVENGFLQNRTLQFNKHLNCLIGGKGTGKSSVVELIRYALDIDPRSEDIQKEYEGLIEHNLANDGEVRLMITGNNGEKYRIRRRYDESPEIERISDEESEEPNPVDIPIEEFKDEFFDAEIHSQRELLALARSHENQLNLLDSYFDIDEGLQNRKTAKKNIREKSREIASLEETVAELKRDEQRFETLRQQVQLMKEKGVDEYVEGQEDWERERAELSKAIEGVEQLEEMLEGIDPDDAIHEVDVRDGPNEELLSSAQDVVQNLQEDVREQYRQLLETVSEASGEVEAIREEWNEANEEREAEHSRLADEIADEIGVDIDEFFAKQSELEELRGITEELEAKSSELESAREQKAELFGELEDARQALTEARRTGIKELNGELNDVRVSLEKQTNRDEYIRWVNHVLEGSNVYTNDKEKISNALSPRELAAIVRNKAVDELADEAEITRTAAENFIEHDDLNERLTELELLEIRDRPIIELNDGGWKELSEMSDGQQCTTLLSITMVERDVPLIIDQPEDMLDNKFIYSEVVTLIRSIKHDRQIITATHNANIPVLGDAEQIIVMRSNSMSGFYRRCGSIDDTEVKQLTQDILEGGEQAFRRRNDKYRRSV